MRCLLFDNIPQDFEALKSGNPSGMTIVGSMVYQSESIKAILAYGSYDAYYFVRRYVWGLGQYEEGAVLRGGGERVHVLSPTKLSSLRTIDNLVLMTAGPDLYNLLPIRHLLGRDNWPLCGIVHSTNGGILTPGLLNLLLGSYGKHDSLICSTESCKGVIERQLETLQRHISASWGFKPATDIHLPVIPLGVNADCFGAIDKAAARSQLGIAPEKTVVLYFGRFSPLAKGDLNPLIIAFRGVAAENPDVLLVLAGDDTMHRMAAEMRASEPCREQIDVRPDPTYEEKLKLFAAADIFVAISDNLQETFGITVAEALTAGLPVIAADWDGYKDLVDHGKTGFLVPTYMPRLGLEVDLLSSSRNWLADQILAQTTAIDPGHLQRHISVLVRNAACRQRMGCFAREAAKRFAWKSVVQQYEQLWDAALDNRGGPAVNPARRGSVDLYTYSYQRIFEHYPTRFIEDGDILRLSDNPTKSLSSFGGVMNSLFDEGAFNNILRMLEEKGPYSVAQIVDEAGRNDGLSPFVVKTHISRLLKYGAIDLCSPRSLWSQAAGNPE